MRQFARHDLGLVQRQDLAHGVDHGPQHLRTYMVLATITPVQLLPVLHKVAAEREQLVQRHLLPARPVVSL